MSELPDTGNRMTIVHRDVRVTARGLGIGHRNGSPGPAGLAQRVNAMLAAIARRYARWQGRWPHLHPILGHPGRGITLQSVVHRTQLHLVPHLRLTVLARSGPEGAPSAESATRRGPVQERSTASRLAGQPPAAAPGHQPLEMLVGRLQAGRLVETVPVETIVNRLVRRGVRVETVGTPRPQLPQFEGSTAEAMRPVPRIVRRTAAAMSGDNPPTAAETFAVTSSPRPAMAQVPGHGEPPLDLNSLTDQVVQAIDRRIIAQRERLGRV
jgi:hypothetical protein